MLVVCRLCARNRWLRSIVARLTVGQPIRHLLPNFPEADFWPGVVPGTMSWHGFRTLESIRLYQLAWNCRWIETQLSHAEPNPLPVRRTRELAGSDREPAQALAQMPTFARTRSSPATLVVRRG